MKELDRIKGGAGLALGMLTHLVGFVLFNLHHHHPGESLYAPPVVLYVIATLILTYACCYYIKSKEYPWQLGLTALIPIPPWSLVGISLACLLPDRSAVRAPEPATSRRKPPGSEQSRPAGADGHSRPPE